MTLHSSINREIYGHVVRAPGGGGSQYIPRLCITEEYIHWLHVTDEYIFIFFSTDEYSSIYSWVLYSSVASSVNRGI
jgi:hypothetical protein